MGDQLILGRIRGLIWWAMPFLAFFYSGSQIFLHKAGQFLNARNGVGHQVNLVEDIIPDVLLCAIFFEQCSKSSG